LDPSGVTSKRSSNNVDVEEFEDAPVHQLQDAGHNPGRAAAGGEVHGLRPPHESRTRRLRGVPQASPGQRQEDQQRGARGPPHTRPRPPPRRRGHFHDRGGPTTSRGVPRQGCQRCCPGGTRDWPRCWKRGFYGAAHSGTAWPSWARPRRGWACTRYDAATTDGAPAAFGSAHDVPDSTSDPAAFPDAATSVSRAGAGSSTTYGAGTSTPWAVWREAGWGDAAAVPYAVCAEANGATTAGSDDERTSATASPWDAPATAWRCCSRFRASPSGHAASAKPSKSSAAATVRD